MRRLYNKIAISLRWLIHGWVRYLSDVWLHASDRCLRTFYPDDVLLVSFMRSGNTWLRFLVGNLVSPDQPVTFANLERILPEIYLHSNRELARYPRPRMIKSHDTFDPRYPKVIYIVRDPRDVALSLYNFARKQQQVPAGYPLEKFIDGFITGEFSFLYSWSDNVASWLATRYGTDRFLLMRYEDIKANPTARLGEIASFLGIAAGPERLARAVELSSSERMRALERQGGEEWMVIGGTRKDIPFVGTATTGGWRTALPGDCVRKIESAWGPVMKLVGYELSTDIEVRDVTPLADLLTARIAKGSPAA